MASNDSATSIDRESLAQAHGRRVAGATVEAKGGETALAVSQTSVIHDLFLRPLVNAVVSIEELLQLDAIHRKEVTICPSHL
jgi:hypothetical protein